MGSSARILAIVGTLVVLVIAFVALKPSDDEPAATTTASTTTPAPTTPAVAPQARPAPEPKFSTIRVRDGEPVGGVKKIEVDKGERARIEVSSPDTSDAIHIHGYDLTKDLEAGRRVRFSFTADADADGIYEIELENAGVQVAQLVVSPS